MAGLVHERLAQQGTVARAGDRVGISVLVSHLDQAVACRMHRKYGHLELAVVGDVLGDVGESLGVGDGDPGRGVERVEVLVQVKPPSSVKAPYLCPLAAFPPLTPAL